MNSITLSQSAVKIALDTLKERCKKFQIEINNLEEENVQLKKKQNETKINKQYINEDDPSTSVKNDQIQEQNDSLHIENNLLKKRLSLLTNENKYLWTRLSKLSESNNYMGNQLNAISSTLKKHSSQNSTRNEKKVIAKCQNQSDGSLEEISLKIIHNILKEKQELESQCAEMVEIQNNFSSLTMSEFGISFYDPSESLLLEDLKQHLEKLNSFKSILKSQQDTLKTNIINLDKINNASNNCNTCKERLKIKNMMTSTECQTQESSYGFPINNQITDEEDRICPLCSKIFPRNMAMDIFVTHVMQCIDPLFPK